MPKVLTNKIKEDEGIGYLYDKEGQKVPVSTVNREDVNTLITQYLAQNPTLFSPKIIGKYLQMDANGDITFGNYAGGAGVQWNQSAGTFTIKGALSAGSLDIPDTITANSFHANTDGDTWWGATAIGSAVAKVLNTGVATFADITITGGSILTSVLSGLIAQGNLNVADRGWTQTSAFSVTDADTVAWGAGTFTSADGTAYTISAGNTGNMTAKTYIYLDTAVSTTAYQTTTTSTTAVGIGKVLIAIAQNATTEATYKVMQGQGGENIDAANIVAGSITANEIAANTIVAGNIVAGTITGNEIAASTITSGKLSVTLLSAISANLGTITAGSININDVFTVDSSGNTRVNSLERNDFHWWTMFESIDGYAQSISGAGTITCNPQSVDFVTGANNTNFNALQKIHPASSDFSWDKDRKFKMLVKVDENTTIWCNFGTGNNLVYGGNTARHIGFYFINGQIYSTVANGTTESSTANITTYSTSAYVVLEVKFTAGSKAEFYVNGLLKDTLTTNLPSGTTDAERLFEQMIYTLGGVRNMHIVYWDFWQEN